MQDYMKLGFNNFPMREFRETKSHPGARPETELFLKSGAILLAAYSLPLRLFPFQILVLYLYLFLFYEALKYSVYLIQTNISDYPLTTIWCL